MPSVETALAPRGMGCMRMKWGHMSNGDVAEAAITGLGGFDVDISESI